MNNSERLDELLSQNAPQIQTYIRLKQELDVIEQNIQTLASKVCGSIQDPRVTEMMDAVRTLRKDSYALQRFANDHEMVLVSYFATNAFHMESSVEEVEQSLRGVAEVLGLKEEEPITEGAVEQLKQQRDTFSRYLLTSHE